MLLLFTAFALLTININKSKSLFFLSFFFVLLSFVQSLNDVVFLCFFYFLFFFGQTKWQENSFINKKYGMILVFFSFLIRFGLILYFVVSFGLINKIKKLNKEYEPKISKTPNLYEPSVQCSNDVIRFYTLKTFLFLHIFLSFIFQIK